MGFQGLLPGPVERPPILLPSVGLFEAADPLLLTGEGAALAGGGGLGGFILKVGTVGLGAGLEDATLILGDDCAGDAVFPLAEVVLVCTVDLVWMVEPACC